MVSKWRYYTSNLGHDTLRLPPDAPGNAVAASLVSLALLDLLTASAMPGSPNFRPVGLTGSCSSLPLCARPRRSTQVALADMLVSLFGMDIGGGLREALALLGGLSEVRLTSKQDFFCEMMMSTRA